MIPRTSVAVQNQIIAQPTGNALNVSRLAWAGAIGSCRTASRARFSPDRWSTMLDEQPVETTLYSLDEAAPPQVQRRESERVLTLLRVGALTVGGRRELCLIRNVSAGG